MQLFLMEMKKILSWKLLLLIGIVNVLLFYLFLSFDLEYFPNGRPDGDLFKIEQMVISKYGSTLDEKEFKELRAIYEERLRVADKFFSQDDQAQTLGITNYKEFQDTGLDDQELGEYHDELMFQAEEDFLWELQAWNHLIENYETEALSLNAMIGQTAGSRHRHFQKQLTNEEYSFFSSVVPYNFQNYKTSMAIIILISIAILMSPVFLRDYQSGLLPLQYTSKTGRSVYKTKWLAGVSSAAILTVILLTVYTGMYWTNGTASHFDLPLSAFAFEDYWYEMTFLQYIILSITAIFFAAILLGILSMAISTVVQNSIVLIGLQIVVLFIMIAGVANFLIREITNIWLPQALVPGGYIVLTAVIFISGRLMWKRELQKDVT